MIPGVRSIARNVVGCWATEPRILEWETLRLLSRSDDDLMLAASPLE